MQIKIKNEEFFNIQRQYGIYAIRCLVNNRIYIGSTKQSFRARFSNHCKFLGQQKLGNKGLQDDYNLHGPENFEFEIISIIMNENDIVIGEQQFIDNLHPYYNVMKTANNNSRTNLNKKFTKEHREKIREKSKLFKHENIDKIIDQNKKGANKFELTNLTTGEIKFIDSTLELQEFFDMTTIRKYYDKKYKGWYIKLLKTQSKNAELFINNEWKIFESFEKCDKFLNKWRGYTSTQSLRNVTELCGYSVKFNN